MGLSKRRRAYCDNSSIEESIQAVKPTRNLNRHSDDKSKKARNKTHRRLGHKNTMTMPELLSFQVESSQLQIQNQPFKSRPPIGELFVQPNINFCYEKCARVFEYLYDSTVTYSTKKRSRWMIKDQLADESGTIEGRRLLDLSMESRRKRGNKMSSRQVDKSRQTELLDARSKCPQGSNDKQVTISMVDDTKPRAKLFKQFPLGQRRQRNKPHIFLENRDCDFDFNHEPVEDDFDANDVKDNIDYLARRKLQTVFDVIQYQSATSCASSLVLDAHYRERGTYQRKTEYSADFNKQKIFSDSFEPQQQSLEAEFLEAIDTERELLNNRPLLRVQTGVASLERLRQLFNGTNALFISDSKPCKFAVLLQHAGQPVESVSFELVSEDEDEGCTTLAVYHSFIWNEASRGSRLRTSSTEIASLSDPFAYLWSLTSPSSKVASAEAPMAHLSVRNPLPDGWCRTEVWEEADARIAAFRALPMFSVSVASACTSNFSDQIASRECIICCSPNCSGATVEISERFTSLGGCGHRFCNLCLVQHVTSCLKAGKTLIECPSCPAVLDAAVLLWFCPQRLLQLLAGAAFRSWQRRFPASRFCPLSYCGRLVTTRDCGMGSGALCKCWSCFCLLCGEEPHWPLDCAAANQYRMFLEARGHAKLRAGDLDASIKVFCKKCPSCLAVVEIGIGCDYRTCICGKYFCWDCGRVADERSQHSCSKKPSPCILQKEFSARGILLSPSSKQSRLYCTAVKTRLARCSELVQLECQRRLTRRLLSATAWPTANIEEVIADARMASYLVEYTCVFLHTQRAPAKNRRAVSAVLTSGEAILSILGLIGAELQIGRRAVCRRIDVTEAKRVCSRLAELYWELTCHCKQLREAANHFLLIEAAGDLSQ